MLGFGLRATWFSLSLSGLVACWITMISFGRALRTFWGPILYCFGCTLLQGIFCLGLIYRMDPFRMPQAFCTAQPIIMGFATFLMSGVAAAFTMATCEAAKKPKTWPGGGTVALAWRRVYLFPLVAFPVLASIIQISVTLSLDSGERADDLHCDYAQPEWLRFTSYAGSPLLATIPTFVLSIRSVIQISKHRQHIARSRDPGEILDQVTPAAEPPRRVHMRLGRMLSSSTFSFLSSNERHPMKQVTSRLQLRHYPADSTRDVPSVDLNNPSLDEYPDKHPQDLDRTFESRGSSSFPTFANPPSMGTVSVDPDGRRNYSRRSTDCDERGLHTQPSGGWLEVLGPLEDTPDVGDVTDPESDTPTKRGDLEWSDMSYRREGSVYKGREGVNYVESVEDRSGSPTRRVSKVVHQPLGMFRRRRPLPHLDAAVVRIITFQFCFTSAHIFCTLSTLIDVIKSRSPPSPFGTQHVALLFSAWGPVFIFGILPLCSKRAAFLNQWT